MWWSLGGLIEKEQTKMYSDVRRFQRWYQSRRYNGRNDEAIDQVLTNELIESCALAVVDEWKRAWEFCSFSLVAIGLI